MVEQGEIFKNLKILNNIYCDKLVGDGSLISNLNIAPGTLESINGSNGIITKNNNFEISNITDLGYLSLDETILRRNQDVSFQNELTINNSVITSSINLNGNLVLDDDLVVDTNLNINYNTIINLGTPNNPNDLSELKILIKK